MGEEEEIKTEVDGRAQNDIDRRKKKNRLVKDGRREG